MRKAVLGCSSLCIIVLANGCGSSGAVAPSSASTSSAAAQSECGAIAQGSEGAIAACAQGYDAAKAGKPEVSSCAVGSGAVASSENVTECRAGWAAGDVGTAPTTTTASAAAQSACGAIAQGSEGAIAACTQGYDAAKAGKPQGPSCDKVGAGAILSSENVTECREGWAAGHS
jgi:hypothetical protein